MKISLVAAVAKNNAIGRRNELLWHLPADFKHFKNTTSNHYILMGRKTFESFPKPLPNRIHLIVTKQLNYEVPENCFVFSSIEEAITFAVIKNQEIVYVIGGGEIYRQTIQMADELIVTHVEASFNDADAFFPEIGDQWHVVSKVFFEADDKNIFDFTIIKYQK